MLMGRQDVNRRRNGMRKRSVRPSGNSACRGTLLLLLAATATPAAKDCGECHAEIAEAYSATPMAGSSGRVVEVPRGSFRQDSSNVQYEVDPAGLVWISRGTEKSARKLDYYIGSGA